MCGIVGYIGSRDAVPIILDGLRRLEYRGYDSTGIAVLEDKKIEVRRAAGKLKQLLSVIEMSPISGSPGIGHTRWATHGLPIAKNAHPHLSANSRVVLVHNGIVENFRELRDELVAGGVNFRSDTDTETIVQLVEKNMVKGMNLLEASRSTFNRLRGAHAIVLYSVDEPDKIICARIGNAGGIAIGLGENENFIASDMPAIAQHTRRFIFLETHQIAVITKKNVKVETFQNQPLHPKVHTVSIQAASSEKGNYKHFMEKEIFEQVQSLTDTISGRIDFNKGQILLPELNLKKEKAREIQRIIITACGTAAHAGMVGKYLIEKIARIPCEVQIASEFRYNDPIIDENSVVLAISQSGETADTLAAMDEGKKKGAILWSIVNAIGSQAMRIADGTISMQTGPEIGVASTKAFTAPLVDLYMLAVLLADLRNMIDNEKCHSLVADLLLLPQLASQTLNTCPDINRVAQSFSNVQNCLFLGRGINMPIAYEGALKLKEVSYIHAEGYPAGEMKHGPISLVDKKTPVVCLAPDDPWKDKMISQIQQVKARGGRVITVATRGDEMVKSISDLCLWIPDTPWLLNPVISIIPLQLLAYFIASMRGLDVDQPRNLAKSVTVE